MRIIQINKSYYPRLGGIETVVKQLAEGYAGHDDVESHVVAINDDPTRRDDLEEEIRGVTVKKARLNFFFGSQPVGFSLIRMLKGCEADIFHIHLPNPFGVIAYLIARPKGKLVITYHSDIVKQKILRKFYQPFSMMLLRKARIIISTSENLSKVSPTLCHYSDKVQAIPLGIAPDEYQLDDTLLEKTREEFGENFLLSIGRLVEYKGFRYGIKAMKRVEKQKLFIIGDGPQRTQLLDTIKHDGVGDRVEILPSMGFERLKCMIHLSRLFLFPSISNNEAFGIVQLEAMLFGKPVISSDLPTGVTFVNKHEKTGLITRRKDPVSIAEGINRLLNDEELYNSICDHNSHYVRENFSESKMVDSYLGIYGSLLLESGHDEL